jgi:multidrug transporter EmrE-like cation transporter
MIHYIFLAISILMAVVGQLLMKKGMMVFGTFPANQLVSQILPMLFNPYNFFGLILLGSSMVFWLAVLSELELSLVYPMISIAYVLVAIASWIFFKENLTPVRWAGIAVIIIGVVLISRS